MMMERSPVVLQELADTDLIAIQHIGHLFQIFHQYFPKYFLTRSTSISEMRDVNSDDGKVSCVVLQELAGTDLITDLFVKIFPAAEFWAISQYSGGSASSDRGYDKFFPELSDK